MFTSSTKLSHDNFWVPHLPHYRSLHSKQQWKLGLNHRQLGWDSDFCSIVGVSKTLSTVMSRLWICHHHHLYPTSSIATRMEEEMSIEKNLLITRVHSQHFHFFEELPHHHFQLRKSLSWGLPICHKKNLLKVHHSLITEFCSLHSRFQFNRTTGVHSRFS